MRVRMSEKPVQEGWNLRKGQYPPGEFFNIFQLIDNLPDVVRNIFTSVKTLLTWS